jgi:hypothetical protein
MPEEKCRTKKAKQQLLEKKKIAFLRPPTRLEACVWNGNLLQGFDAKHRTMRVGVEKCCGFRARNDAITEENPTLLSGKVADWGTALSFVQL